MSKEESFEEWSLMWDSLFTLCEEGKLPFNRLLEHTLQYKQKWNKGEL